MKFKISVISEKILRLSWFEPVCCILHSSTLAWNIPWMEEPGGLQSMGRKESDTTEQLHFHFSLSCIGEGNGNPLQCSCLENPRDGGAWWAAVYGVTPSRTRLKWLSSSSMYKVLGKIMQQIPVNHTHVRNETLSLPVSLSLLCASSSCPWIWRFCFICYSF